MNGADLAALAAAYTAAWNSGRPEAVASHYAEDGQIIINAGTPWLGRAGVTEMAAGIGAGLGSLADRQRRLDRRIARLVRQRGLRPPDRVMQSSAQRG